MTTLAEAWAWGKVCSDGREICNLLVTPGRDEYMLRIRKMWLRQEKKCCLCGGRLALQQATFEHQDGRGMNGGHRDDRIEKPDENGVMHPYNGAAHRMCNDQKGSRRVDYTGFYEVP
jgi:hypothetical protein